MTPAIVLQALLTYGPTIIPLIQRLVADIEAGKGNKQVTAADLEELSRLAGLTAEALYARVGITPPPKGGAP